MALPALLLAAAAPASSQSPAPSQGPAPSQSLEEVQRSREAAAAAARTAAAEADAQTAETDRLAAARVTAADALRATEDQLADLADRIAALQRRHDAAAAAAETQAARLAPLLPLAERLGLYPAETLLSVPAPPEQAVRGVLVLQELAREVRAQVAALADERTRAGAMARELDATRQLQATQATRQREQATALDAQLADAQHRRELAQDAASQAARRAATEAARAESLRAAIATIEAHRASEARAASAAARAAAQAAGGQLAALSPTPLPAPRPGRGGWTVPVAGRVSRDFGAATDAGPASGLTFQPPPGARVVAPCPGRVVFAGPFRSYGQLLILQCEGLHAVLAGLGRLDAAVGQEVRGGEPLGVMGSGGDGLYVEIRRAGVAIDPAQYLRQKG